MAFSSALISIRKKGSSADKGSSRSNAFGDVTSARASATRCCCPPDSSDGQTASELLELDLLEIVKRNRVPLGLIHTRYFQGERDIIEHREVREERIVLEHH